MPCERYRASGFPIVSDSAAAIGHLDFLAIFNEDTIEGFIV